MLWLKILFWGSVRKSVAHLAIEQRRDGENERSTLQKKKKTGVAHL